MYHSPRLSFGKKAALLLLAALPFAGGLHAQDASSAAPPAPKAAAVEAHWLEGAAPKEGIGATWGVPWPRGTVKAGQTFSLQTAKGEAVPVQTWPLATWPDGSLKWTAHAIGAGVVLDGKLRLTPGDTAAAPVKPLTVNETADAIEIDTGVMRCRLSKASGATTIFESISRDGREIATGGRLVCIRQDHADGEGDAKQEDFVGTVSKVTLEQRGPIRAVVKIEGQHRNEKSGRAWLPFIVRLYFYAGAEGVRVMHTFIQNGDENKDFIRGLGVRFDVPMRDELYNRHIRFGGDGKGLFAEGVRNLTGLRRDVGRDANAKQVAGEAVAADSLPGNVRREMDLIPAWNDYTLSQLSADGFGIRKRTKQGYGWIDAGYGNRASGLGYIGSPSGGVAFGIRNFWQSFPNQLDVRNATTDKAEVTMWLWSPDARPMDLRFYHDEMGMSDTEKQLDGLDITYEDYEPGFGTPKGIARTSEMMLWALPATPSRERLAAMSDAVRTPAAVVCEPAAYAAAGAFGGPIWSPADRSTPARTRIEDQLDWYFDFYKKEVEQRHWYGFWNFGDVMHTYDRDRHVWRYDVGGFAWDNSELSSDIWLWYSFLRTGRADVFRMAEAMTRHTGEVDVYHLGQFAGLGTRHGVQHWGDSAKQLRIATAENRRFYYYLTGDERVGDLLHEETNADRKLVEINPTRKLAGAASHQDDYPATVSFGTDWGSTTAALLTEWERTGDAKYRDKLVAGMKGIGAMPHGWFSGSGGYDPETGTIYPLKDTGPNAIHLNAVFGSFEVNAELVQLLDVPEYTRAWIQYCELYNAGGEEQRRVLGKPLANLNLEQGHSRLTAFAAYHNKDPKLAARAWGEFFRGKAGIGPLPWPFPVKRIEGPNVLNPVNEAPWVSTNAVAQWGLAAIEDLALVGKELPPEIPAAQAVKP